MKLEIGLDWLTWSLPEAPADLKFEVQKLLTSTGESVPAGHGYEGAEVAAYGTLGVRGADLLVNLPGQALQYCRETLAISDRDLCQQFIAWGFKSTRLDVALDTQNPRVNPKLAWDAWTSGNLTCTALKSRPPFFPPVAKGKKPDQSGKGMTTYIGMPKSVRMLRVYDKAQEWRDKFPENADAFPAHCTRFELQNRHEAAQLCAELVARDGANALRPVLAGWIDFKDPKHKRVEIKKRRSAPWWNEIVGDQVDYLGLHARAATPLQTRQWISSVGCARAVKLSRMFGFSEKLEDKIDEVSIPPKILKKWEAEKAKRCSSYFHSPDSAAHSSAENAFAFAK